MPGWGLAARESADFHDHEEFSTLQSSKSFVIMNLPLLCPDLCLWPGHPGRPVSAGPLWCMPQPPRPSSEPACYGKTRPYVRGRAGALHLAAVGTVPVGHEGHSPSGTMCDTR